MVTRKLTPEELERFRKLFADTRTALLGLSNQDPALLFAYRRKLYKELSYDERGKPSVRMKLKRQKLVSQDGKCALCGEPLPPAGKGAVLDRLDAMALYTFENTRLLCQSCDQRTQEKRGYRG